MVRKSSRKSSKTTPRRKANVPKGDSERTGFTALLTSVVGNVTRASGTAEVTGITSVSANDYAGFLSRFGYTWQEYRIKRVKFTFIPTATVNPIHNGDNTFQAGGFMRSTHYFTNELPIDGASMSQVPCQVHNVVDRFSHVVNDPAAWITTASAGPGAPTTTVRRNSPWVGIMANAASPADAIKLRHYGVAWDCVAASSTGGATTVYTIFAETLFQFRGVSTAGATLCRVQLLVSEMTSDEKDQLIAGLLSEGTKSTSGIAALDVVDG